MRRLYDKTFIPYCSNAFKEFLLMLLLFFLNPVQAYGGAVENRGIGARAIGMGGAFTGVAENVYAAYYNPAGLGQLDNHQICFDLLYVTPQVSLQRGSGAKEDAFNKSVKALVVGMATKFSSVLKIPSNLVFAYSFYLPDFSKSAWKARYGPPRFDPYYPMYGADMHEEENLKLMVGAGAEIFPWLFLGGGLEVKLHAPGACLVLSADIMALKTVPEQSKVDPLVVTSEIYPLAGILLKPLPSLRVGFAYRQGGYIVFNGGLRAKLRISYGDNPGDTFPLPEEIRDLVCINLPIFIAYYPSQYAFGISYKIQDRLLLAFDMTYYEWRTYKDNSGMQLSPKLDSIFIPRFGMEYSLMKKLAVRTGYSFQASPLKQQDQGNADWLYLTNLIDNDVHTITCGLGYTWQIFGFPRKPAELSAFYELHILPERTFQNVNPGAPEITSSGMFHTYGFGFQFNY